MTIYPLNISAAARNDSGQITVTSNTSWSIIQVSDSVSIDEDDMSGTGNATVDWYISGNPLLQQRTATITFQTADGTIRTVVTITQAAGEMRVSPNTLTFAGSGDSKAVTLYSSANWEVYSRPSWITEVRPGTGNSNTPGGQGITVKAGENTAPAARSGQVIFKQTVFENTAVLNVSQSGVGLESLTIEPDGNVYLDDGDATTQALAITSTGGWSIDLTESFGTGNSEVTLTIPANTGGTLVRHTVKVRSGLGTIVRDLFIWQPASSDSISFDPDEDITFTEDYNTAQIRVLANRGWTAASSDSWLQVSPSTGSPNTWTTVTLTAAVSRTKIKRATFTVTTQGGATKSITCIALPTVQPFDPI